MHTWYEGHASVGVGVGLGQVSIGGSHTDGNRTVKGVDATIRPGAATVLVGAAVAEVIFAPEVIVPLKPVLFKANLK